MQTSVLSRTQLLHEVARHYVVNGLGGKDFSAIPYDKNAVLRAPLCPGGSNHPLYGKENIRLLWWAPLPSLIGEVKLIDSYVNDDDTAVTVEFHCEILNPSCTLRAIDRFKINQEGKIIEQENFFDPRDVTNPGSKG